MIVRQGNSVRYNSQNKIFCQSWQCTDINVYLHVYKNADLFTCQVKNSHRQKFAFQATKFHVY